MNGVAFFCVADHQLWRTDGTAEGTKPVRQNHGLIIQYASELTRAGQGLYFTVRDELWRTDGTAPGTRKHQFYRNEFADLERAAETLYISVRDHVRWGLCPMARDRQRDRVHRRWRLWLSHGSTLFAPLDQVRSLTKVGRDIYFAAGQDQSLWKTDGTSAGTVEVADGFEMSSTGVVNGELYFTAADPDTGASTLRKSDGSRAGTVIVKPGLLYLQALESGGNRFLAGREDEGLQIWKTDGTPAGARQLSAFQPSSSIGSLYR